MKLLSQESKKFIDESCKLEQDKILYLAKKKGLDGPFILDQIIGKQTIARKVPLWKKFQLLFPAKLSLEQCSSELTAKYKSKIIKGKTIVDLTGGFGVDTFFLAKSFKETHYCETDIELAQKVQYNFKQMNQKIKVHEIGAIEFLKQLKKPFDCIYLDPSRRSKNKKRVYKLEDYSPNVVENLDILVKSGQQILIKTAPFLDIKEVITKLKWVSEIHVVATNNDCKEVLYLLNKAKKTKIKIYTTDLTRKENFSFFLEQETEKCNLSPPKNFLYEPNAAIMKAGAFHTIAKEYHIEKLSLNSHLYSSEKLHNNFPGRKFKIKAVCSFNKKEVYKYLSEKKANITKRNFPITTEKIREKLKLKDGGNDYLFATTLSNKKKIIIICQKC